MPKNPLPPVNFSNNIDRYIGIASVLIFFVFLLYTVKQFRENVTVYQTEKLYALCQEQGGILVSSQCFRERIELEIPDEH